ncbi:O-antigen ligase family protein [Lutispora saccharofermentans]|uniref:O-antigen ligase family protein n=1 Tax=Lutispora saccharofermentans TaxID=3024236 RepID=A0ABT1NAA4_9FIRM|nr:O-antigen ligase family protein [Lutispora saccharofermentans]MCQ1528182.1 O-antigen ligase family protein [Lutispora saccharofermentans]
MGKTLTSFILFALVAGIIVPPLGYLAVLGLLIAFIASDRIKELLDPIIQNKPFFLLIVSISVSALFSKIFVSSAIFLVFVILQSLYYSMAQYYLKNRGIGNLFNVLNYMAIITSLFGLFQFLTGNLEINEHWTGYSESLSSLTRIYSTLYNPNIFAAYLVINICFILSWIIYMDYKPSKYISLVLCSFCLILTYSRGAFVSLIAALVIMYALKKDSRFILYSAAMIILFLLFNKGAGYERINIARINSDSSSVYRIEIWRTSLRIFMEHPFVGNGVGTLWYSLSQVSPKLWGVVYHAHDIFLHFAAETGIIGLVSFVSIFHSLMAGSMKKIKNACGSLERFAALGTIGTSVAIMIHGLIDAVIVVPTLTLILMNYYSLACYASGFFKPITLKS